MSKQINNFFVDNMKALRKAYGFRQEGLASEFNMSGQRYSKIETKRLDINLDDVIRVSRFYKIPIDIMCDVNLEDKLQRNDLKGNIILNENFALELFPRFFDDAVCADKKFDEGVKHYKRILYGGGEGFEECEISFFEAWKKTKNKMAIANCLSLAFLENLSLEYNDNFKYSENSTTNDITITHENALKITSAEDFDVKSQKTIDKNIKNINKYITILKSDAEWSDLGDYYFAVRYVYSYVNNPYGRTVNTFLGMDLLKEFAEMGNKYAIRFFSK